MMNPSVRVAAFVAILATWSNSATAAVLFTDSFNTDSSGSWTVNVAPAANAAQQDATFAFNYSTMGIPAAPGSGDTLGLRLRANIPGSAANPVTTRPAGVLSGLSVSPTGQNFGADYQMSFYAWSNFFGSPNAQGLADNVASEGGTNNVLFAVGTAGNVPLVVGNTTLAGGASMDGVGFATTGDGGILNDYRVYPKSGTIVPAATAGVYAAGSHLNTNAFYTNLFPAQMAPAIQQALSTAEYGSDAANTQAGSTQPGSFGFAWHKVVVTKNAGVVTWDVNDTRIATYDASALTLGGNNIALGVSDVNTTTARHPSLVFTVFDNLVVSDLPGALAGDFNDDQLVNGADLSQWQGDFGLNAESDADADADSDGEDFLIWQRNLGATASIPTSVPEPATWTLLATAALPLSRRRIQRSPKR